VLVGEEKGCLDKRSKEDSPPMPMSWGHHFYNAKKHPYKFNQDRI